MFKILVAGIFRLIEKEVFSNHCFIKKVPIKDRPGYVRELLYSASARYGASDHTSFEAHVKGEMMANCEFVVYDYMTKYLPEHGEFMDLVRRAIGGEQTCDFQWFSVQCGARRMSGEMCTSLGNGLTNLLSILFLFDKLKREDVRVVVEGDDSLFSYTGQCPTAGDFLKLGFTLKLEHHESLSEASFCGMIFDIKDEVNISDPHEALASFGWAGSSYSRFRKGKLLCLLRCKALSYAHQYPGCPIINALARYGLRATRSYDVRGFIEKNRSFSMWEREQYRSAAEDRIPQRDVPFNTRLLVEKMYGISVEVQIRVENYLDSLNQLQELRGPILDLKFPRSWEVYYERYNYSCLEYREVDNPPTAWRTRFLPFSQVCASSFNST
jgi:hypothetical protein